MVNRHFVLTHSDIERIARGVADKIVRFERFRPIQKKELESLIQALYGLKPSSRRKTGPSLVQAG